MFDDDSNDFFLFHKHMSLKQDLNNTQETTSDTFSIL